MNTTDEFIRILQNLATRQENLELTLVTLLSFLATSRALSPAQHQELGTILANQK